jgi:hypothetical protein
VTARSPPTASEGGAAIDSRGTLRVTLPSEEIAGAVLRALEPENDGYATARREGPILVVESSQPSPGALLHALDDVLACISAAERSIAAGGAAARPSAPIEPSPAGGDEPDDF